MASRLFLCLAAACCLFYLLALLPPPAQARPGLLTGGLGGRRLLLRLLPVPEPRLFVPTEPTTAQEQQQLLRGGVPVRKARSTWSPAAAAGSVTPELRAVPGGPDPLHHHGGSPSRRPDQDHGTPSP